MQPRTVKARKKPIIVEATQWFDSLKVPGVYPLNCAYLKDHPLANSPCKVCGKPYKEHGTIEMGSDSHTMCPGDWVMTDANGNIYPCKNDIFMKTYDIIEEETSDDKPNT